MPTTVTDPDIRAVRGPWPAHLTRIRYTPEDDDQCHRAAVISDSRVLDAAKVGETLMNITPGCVRPAVTSIGRRGDP
jgi:hypothetical protein